MFQNMIRVPKSFEDALVESANLDKLPPDMIQYGVKFKTERGEDVSQVRFREWGDAASFAEGEVKAGRASGFWIFKEAAV